MLAENVDDNASRCAKLVGNIVLCISISKPAVSLPKAFAQSLCPKPWPALLSSPAPRLVNAPVPCSSFITYATLNPFEVSPIPIDRFGKWCRLPGPDQIQGLTLPRRFRMALQAHLVELERKHKLLENELHEALVHLSTDDLQIAELKRRKLMVKDQIERLKHATDETLH